MTSNRANVGKDGGAGWQLFVPGRVEVLGKHTDYAGGSSLTFATEFGIDARSQPRADGKLVLHDRSAAVDFETPIPPTGAARPEDWTLYPWTLAQRMVRDFEEPFVGATIEWTTALPQAAGLSSSSALLIMLFLALRETQQLAEQATYRRAIDTNTTLAGYLAAVESGRAFAAFDAGGGVGTRGGAGDHTAILCSQADRLHHYSYDPHRLRSALKVPAGCVFAIGVSGVAARKAGNAAAQYDRATRLASCAAEVWRDRTGGDEAHLGAMLRSASAADLRAVLNTSRDREFSGQELVRRLDHFVIEELEVLPAALEALSSGDLTGFADAVERSQLAAEERLGNQVPQTSYLQREARRLGAHAASAFGAGFGGSVWALVDADQAGSFLDGWARSYGERYPLNRQAACFTSTRPGGPARIIHQEDQR